MLVTYNVENLFDAVADGGEYAQFRDATRWDEAAYHRKLAAVADALYTVAPRGADLLVLQEVESARVVAELQHRHLAGMGYRHAIVAPVANEQAPRPATSIAVLSKLPVRRTGLLQVDPAADPWPSAGARAAAARDVPPPPRPLLELELELPNGETLHLFAAHWKSKRGGERATAGYRRAAAEILRRRIAELLRDDATVDVVIAGDLNETGEVGQGVAAHIGAIRARRQRCPATTTIVAAGRRSITCCSVPGWPTHAVCSTRAACRSPPTGC